MSNLIKPRNETLLHPSADLLGAYNTDGCPKNCVPDWKTDRMESTLHCVPHYLEKLIHHNDGPIRQNS